MKPKSKPPTPDEEADLGHLLTLTRQDDWRDDQQRVRFLSWMRLRDARLERARFSHAERNRISQKRAKDAKQAG